MSALRARLPGCPSLTCASGMQTIAVVMRYMSLAIISGAYRFLAIG